MAIEKLSVILELVSGNYKKEARDAATATGQISNSAKSVTGSLGAMLGPAAIGGAIVGLGKLALAAGENADRLFDLQSQTGLTTDALQEWEFVAKAAGASTEVFSDAVKAVIKNLSPTEGATGAAAKAYDTLGIAVLDASGKLRDGGAITDEVFEKLAGMENITERNALAQDLFGKKWEETISVLDLGTDALAALREEGKGAVVSPEALANADKFRETIEKLKATVGPKLNEALGKIAPVLTEVAEAAGDAFDALEPLLDALGWLADKYGEIDIAVEEGLASQSKWAQGMAIATDVGKGAVFGILGIVSALFDEDNAFQDTTASVGYNIEAMRDYVPAAEGAIVPTERLTTAQRLAGDAAKFHFDQLVRLADFLAAQISPVLAAHDAIIALADAQKIAEDAARDNGKESEEFALAQIEVALKTAEAEAALGTFGANAPASIDAVAQALGISNTAAQTLLETLGLLDGMEVTTTIVSRQINLLEEGVIPEGMGTSRGSQDRSTGRAWGGPVTAGRPYLVGERGPEMMVPAQNGTILPNGWNRPNGPVINVISPTTQHLDQDLQLATILATINTMVEVQ